MLHVVTCYMLHVTCYMLHVVTCYMLHVVTCYMLHIVTCYVMCFIKFLFLHNTYFHCSCIFAESLAWLANVRYWVKTAHSVKHTSLLHRAMVNVLLFSARQGRDKVICCIPCSSFWQFYKLLN
jgi:hypothetical protein